MPDVRERLSSEGADPVGNKPEEYDACIRSEIEKWIEAVKKPGIKMVDIGSNSTFRPR